MSRLAAFEISNLGMVRRQTFDSENRSWIFEGDFRTYWDCGNCVSTIVIGDNLILVGRGVDVNGRETNNVKYFNLTTDDMVDSPTLEGTRRRRFCQLADLNGQLCIFGGYDQEQRFVDCIEIYNPSDDQWRDINNPPLTPRQTSKITANNGILYILDFQSGCTYLQYYNIDADRWALKQIDQRPTAPTNFCFAAVERFLYIFEVVKENNVWKIIAVRFDLSNEWSSSVQLAPRPIPNLSNPDIRAAVWENKIIIYAGKTSSSVILLEEYDLAGDIWNTLATFQTNPYYPEDYYRKYVVDNLITKIN